MSPLDWLAGATDRLWSNADMVAILRRGKRYNNPVSPNGPSQVPNSQEDRPSRHPSPGERKPGDVRVADVGPYP